MIDRDHPLRRDIEEIVGVKGPWPSPMGAAAFTGPLGRGAKFLSNYSEADPAAILAHLLVFFGSACGRESGRRVGTQRHHANLYIGVVGATAGGRKGTAKNDALALMDAAGIDWHSVSGLTSGEGLIHHVRDPQEIRRKAKKAELEEADDEGYITVEEDSGVADKRCCAIETEVARTLRAAGRDSSTLNPVLRDLWDTGDAGTMTKVNPLRTTGAHVSCAVHGSVEELSGELREMDLLNGFANRFLWFCAKRSKSLPEPEVPPETEIRSLGRQIADAVAFARGARIDLEFSADARSRWYEVYDALGGDLPGSLGKVTARALPQVQRLALIYALADCSGTIEARHLDAALEVWGYCLESAAHIFGGSLGDPLADSILEALKVQQEDGLSRSEIHDEINKDRTKVDRALALLTSNGLATERKEPSQGPKGTGRPTTRYYLPSAAPRREQAQETDLSDLSGLSAGSIEEEIETEGNEAALLRAAEEYVASDDTAAWVDEKGDPLLVGGDEERWD
jgi:predicted transcriptional regulator